MPKKQRNQRKKQQRALHKRTKRKQKLASKRSSRETVGVNPRRLLRMAREFPIEGAWVQRDWQARGIARVLLARTQPNDHILFGQYIVDYFCVGIRRSSYTSNMSRSGFFDEYIPFFYPEDKPLAIESELAHEIVWGAVEYAERIGFSPHRGFRDASRILEPADALPRSGQVEFGYNGSPLYFPFPEDDQAAFIRKLIDSVGLGNFYYMPPGDVPDEVIELMQTEGEEDAPEPAIWTPGYDRSGVDAQSGLWIPGHGAETKPAEEPADQPALWTPGRS